MVLLTFGLLAILPWCGRSDTRAFFLGVSSGVAILHLEQLHYCQGISGAVSM